MAEEKDEFCQVPLSGGVSGDKVEIKIESKGEIVSSVHEAKHTLSASELKEQRDALYGDLPEELRAGRAEQEQHWMAPNPEQEYSEFYSENLKGAADDSIVFGNNGTIAFALRCKRSSPSLDEILKQNPPKKGATKNERVAVMEANFQAYAKGSPAFEYKLALTYLEKTAFYKTMRFALSETQTKKEITELLTWVTAISKYDPTLRDPVSKLGPQITRALKKTPTPKPLSMEDRPGKKYASILHATFEFLDTLPPGEKGGDVSFQVLVCKVPLEQTKKQPKWKIAGDDLLVPAGTIPVMAFNETHLVILYQQQPELTNVWIDVFSFNVAGGNISFKRLEKSRKCFQFPANFSRQGFLNVHLSKEGIFSVAFSNGVIVFDIHSAASKEAHSLVLEAGEHKRKVTCAPISGEGGSLVLIGSDKGECYGVEWKTGRLLFIHQVPAVEPIFHVIYSNNRIFMHTICAVSGIFVSPPLARGGGATLEILPIDRPVAMDVCGGLIFILTKYGTVKVFSTHVRNVVHDFPSPPKEKGSTTPLLQHAYPTGLKAYPDKVVCTYANGLTRTIKLKNKK